MAWHNAVTSLFLPGIFNKIPGVNMKNSIALRKNMIYIYYLPINHVFGFC